VHTVDYIFPVWILLAVATVLSAAIFLAAWERTRAVGMAILSLFAGVVILGAAVVFYTAARRDGHRHSARVEPMPQLPHSARPSAVVAQRESGAHPLPHHGKVAQTAATAARNAVASDTATSGDAGDSPASDQSNTAEELGSRGEDVPGRAVQPPDWVVNPPGRSGAVFRRVMTSDPFSTDEECYRQVEDKMLVTTCRYVSDRVGNTWSRELRRQEYVPELLPDQARRYLERLGVDAGYLWKHVCPEPEYREWVSSSVDALGDPLMGPMRRIHVLMEIDEAVQRDLVGRWRESVLVRRLGIAGGTAAAVLALVGVVFVYLKIDTATRGFYSRRLQVVAALVTILIAIAILRVVSA